jgi:DNA-binding response OmpR family regulator
VLIVDDNADAAETLAMLLDSVGHDTRVVIDAERALQAVLEFGPDVVFLDLGMPRLSGFDLARQIRTEKGLVDSVLVALSGWGTEEDRVHSRKPGSITISRSRQRRKPSMPYWLASCGHGFQEAWPS